MAFTVKRDNDPFKKYWWVLLVGFGLVAAWICLPLMEPGTGSGSATRGEEGLKAPAQSLDAMNNPNGAPGGATDLSMDGTGAYKKKTSEGEMTSSLYQAPAEAAAPGAPLAAGAMKMSASSDNLANALRSVAKKAKDDSGWGGAKAQKAFNAPKGAFGSLSGLGGAGGGGSGASMGAFGTSNATPGVSVTRGLPSSGDSSKIAPGSGGGMNALKAAKANALAAAGAKTADLAANLGGKTFDGTGAAGSISNDKGGVYGKLDDAAVPANLKGDVTGKPPDATDSKNVPKDPSKDGKDAVDQQAEMQKKIMEIVVTGLVTGMTNAMVGSIFGTAVQQQMNYQNAQGQLQPKCASGNGTLSGGQLTCN